MSKEQTNEASEKMALDALTSDDKLKLKQTIEAGVKYLEEIDDLRGSLRDQVKALAEQLNVKPRAINRAIKAAYKGDILENKDELDVVEEILYVTGKHTSE